MPVYISQKTHFRSIFYCKFKIIVFIKYNIKITYHLISIGFNHINQFIYCFVDFRIPSGTRIIHIFNCYGIGKFIIGKQISVSVIYIASCPGNFFFFLDSELKRVQIIFSVHNLKIKQTKEQSSCTEKKKKCDDCHSGGNKFKKCFSYTVKQIFSHSFV